MRYQVWIDRGGTFTDCLGRDPATGEVRVAKVLSSDRAPLDGIRRLLELAPDAPIPPCAIRMGTTLATNALLERKGTPTALVITRGFRDLLAIGTQARPALFDLAITRPEVLYREVVEVDARVDAAGAVLARPDPDEVRGALEGLRSRGLDSLAVVVLHAYAAGAIEREIEAIAREAGFSHVSTSHDVAAEIGLVGRGDTTVADAYLTPLIRDYVQTLRAELPGSDLRIMQSSGGLTDADRFRGRDSILSGPAAGVVACAEVARATGVSQAIGFDMGGTSTDVSRWAGDFERVYETEVAGVRMRTPMITVHTVAAGGGSLCRFDGRRFTVGPESAGAEPGPLCYGHPDARELALTDINLALGRIRPDRFPFPLDRARVDQALEALTDRLREGGDDRGPLAVAEGFFRIAVENMAAAIREVSVQRGHDVRDHAMVVFGGAGGQHACAVARRLGIRTLVFHPLAGVLSAYGMGVAPVTWHGEVDAGRHELDGSVLEALEPRYRALGAEGVAALEAEGVTAGEVHVVRRLDLRYAGTEATLTLELEEGDGAAALRQRFEDAHQREWGYRRPGHPVEAVTARAEAVSAWRPGRGLSMPSSGTVTGKDTGPVTGQATLYLGGAHLAVPVVPRESLEEGTPLAGPAVLIEDTGTIVLEPGFEAVLQADGRIVVTDHLGEEGEAGGPEGEGTVRVDPILLEIFNNLFMSVAEQMGTVLRRTALSTNIRDRLDFSCAVFDPEGGLVANAPHIPVHLGAMGKSVRAVLAAHPDPEPGDVFVTNDPAGGGSHLPDVTVVTPVHDGAGRLAFFTASRGHHADVGGITPGSMPPFSHRLEEEGVVLRAERIVHGGRFDREAVRALFTRGSWPARRPDDNVADVEAQIAANRKGERLLTELVERYGPEVVAAYMQHVQDNAAACVAEAIAALPDGTHRFEDALDDGTVIRAALTVDGSQLVVDFAGTGPEHEGNLNAPRAVTIAAVLYVMRCLVGSPIPLNSGCLRPVEIRLPDRSVLSPGETRAVAGGNVETSQRVVDVLLGALGKAAASQGTMNNLTFGDDRFGYYETIGGGAGAGEGFSGASGVHTHMTNSRITDPEVLEARFPVRLVEFSLRPGSGGDGRWRGGDGLVREIEALTPLRVAILSERRSRAPFGLAGGREGARGRNLKRRRDGALEELPGKVECELAAGERIRIETPGGGGFGAP